jgi:hypothetical protein
MRRFNAGFAPALVILLALLIISLVASQPAAGQVLYGSIVGTVQDPSGAVVPGAKITLTHTATGQAREVMADEQGRFNAISLPAGTYDMVVTASGFRTLTRRGIEVTINTVTREEPKLRFANLRQGMFRPRLRASRPIARTRAEISSKTVVEPRCPLPQLPEHDQPRACALQRLPTHGAPRAAFTDHECQRNEPQQHTPARGPSTSTSGCRTRCTTRSEPLRRDISILRLMLSGHAGGAAVTVATRAALRLKAQLSVSRQSALYARPYFYRVTEISAAANRSSHSGGTSAAAGQEQVVLLLRFERTGAHRPSGTTPCLPQREGRNFSRTPAWPHYDPATGIRHWHRRVPFAGNIIRRPGCPPLDHDPKAFADPNQPVPYLQLVGQRCRCRGHGMTRDHTTDRRTIISEQNHDLG